MEGFSFNYDLEMLSTYIWDGVFSFAIANSEMDVENESVQFTNLRGDYVLNFDKEKNTLSIGSGFGIDSLPLELVGENPILLSSVYPGMQTGLFEKKDDILVHKAETRDGKLFINGETVIFN